MRVTNLTAGTIIISDIVDPGQTGRGITLSPSPGYVDLPDGAAGESAQLKSLRDALQVSIAYVIDLKTGEISTGTGATSITKAAAGYTTDQYIGKQVVITSGTAVGQTRKITTNTTTALTIGTAWTTTPAIGSTYSIQDVAEVGVGVEIDEEEAANMIKLENFAKNSGSASVTAHAALTTGTHGAGASTIATTANIATHAGLATGTHGVGGSTVASASDISTHAGLSTGVHGAGAGTLLGSLNTFLSAEQTDTQTVTITGATTTLTYWIVPTAAPLGEIYVSASGATTVTVTCTNAADKYKVGAIFI